LAKEPAEKSAETELGEASYRCCGEYCGPTYRKDVEPLGDCLANSAPWHFFGPPLNKRLITPRN